MDNKKAFEISKILLKNKRQCMIVKELLIDKGMQWQIKTEYDRVSYKAYCFLAKCIEEDWKNGNEVKQKYEIYNELLLYTRYKILIEHAVFVDKK